MLTGQEREVAAIESEVFAIESLCRVMLKSMEHDRQTCQTIQDWYAALDYIADAADRAARRLSEFGATLRTSEAA